MSRIATHALVLVDLVDSTALVEELGDRRAGEIFARVDRLARDLLEQHDGLEIDKTDGFFMLFERTLPAVQFLLALHVGLRGLSDEEGVTLSARSAVHFGEVQLRENSAADISRGAKPLEVEGLAKPFAARLMSVAVRTSCTTTASQSARSPAIPTVPRGNEQSSGRTRTAV